ncbi:uncharacterized protein LOC144449375 [Glandiceps talaboti]
MYLGLQCSDSRLAFPVIQEVAKHYGPNLVRLVFHGYPLPYFKGSFWSVQATRAVDTLNPALTVPYMDSVFNNQHLVKDSPRNVSDADIIQVLTQLAVDLGLDEAAFTEAFEERDTDRLCRHEWKMAITHGVYGSPLVTINDMVIINFMPLWTAEDWYSIIDPLVEGYQTH